MSLDALSIAVDRIYAVFGVGATCSVRDEASRACRVLIDSDVSQYGGTAQVAGKTVVVSVRVREVPCLPRKGDLFDIASGPFAGRALRVDSVVASDELEHKVLAA